jgi:predicted HNH restriction endonuclease
VHHLRPLSGIAEEYEIDPVEDLRPVCPNCHAMLHRKTPPYTIDELRLRLSITGKKPRSS